MNSPDGTSPSPDRGPGSSRGSRRLVAALIVSLCASYDLAVWIGMGGREGLTNPWPPVKFDHAHYFHNAMISPSFLKSSWTTAGYDPSFMAGYPKCIFSVNSSTLPELAFFAFGTARPALVYKSYVLGCVAAVPWLVACAGLVAGLRPGAIAAAVGMFLIYLWTDFPMIYAIFGMVPYLLAIPLGLVTTATISAFLGRGTFRLWWLSAAGSSLVFLVHLTSVMIVAPAAAAAYAVAVVSARRAGGRLPRSRHLGFWSLAPLAMAVNTFWWLPGVWLASTKGPSDTVFVHPEPVLERLGEIVFGEVPIEATLIAGGLVGLVVLARRDRVMAAALAGFAAAGFFWGYLAGGARSLDFLQPGRQTYAFYTALALLTGVGLVEIGSRLRAGGGRLDVWVTLGVVLIGLRLFGPAIAQLGRARLPGPETFLSSQPTPRLLWVVDRVTRHVRPGERLLYEEGGKDLPGVPDPFDGGRYSGLLPHLVPGVELIGGPYLHAHVRSNFTQFGEGKLFERAGWDRDHFTRYARLYRPSAILCWSPHARRFCRSNPDLVRILDEDGDLILGKVVGFEGAAIEGTARVEADGGRLRVSGLVAGPRGLVVLRYHHAPHLRSRPETALEPVFLEEDPVPFIGLRPGPDPLVIEMDLPPLGK